MRNFKIKLCSLIGWMLLYGHMLKGGHSDMGKNSLIYIIPGNLQDLELRSGLVPQPLL